MRRVENSQFTGKAHQQQHTAYSEEEKAEAVQRYLADGEKSGYQLKPEAQWNQYVLVIDEINRGNISKILGELITLIEPDKRLRTGDNQNTLVVTLPYSGERFAVPANLHVLATMNTADKSIALVDVALRRRFDFKELAVDLSVCRQLTGSMRSALQELNRRIVLRKDRDHQIPSPSRKAFRRLYPSNCHRCAERSPTGLPTTAAGRERYGSATHQLLRYPERQRT